MIIRHTPPKFKVSNNIKIYQGNFMQNYLNDGRRETQFIDNSFLILLIYRNSTSCQNYKDINLQWKYNFDAKHGKDSFCP